MKTFWDDFSRKLGETADTVSAKASEVVELQKIKSQIRTMERNNDSDYIELGKMIYEKYKAGEEVEDIARGFCEAIENREESIAEYLTKIDELRGDVPCEICGKNVAKGMSYCPYCGAKIETLSSKVKEAAETVKEKVEDVVEKVEEKVEDIID
ncbi:MAG: zinc ribbon domain-containing protein [Schaedlerella sp.]|nr:zinc ribbon domain-containing protein [Schaedlerella sp.]